MEYLDLGEFKRRFREYYSSEFLFKVDGMARIVITIMNLVRPESNPTTSAFFSIEIRGIMINISPASIDICFDDQFFGCYDVISVSIVEYIDGDIIRRPKYYFPGEQDFMVVAQKIFLEEWKNIISQLFKKLKKLFIEKYHYDC